MSEVKKIDPESRDYDLKDIQVDARFTQTTKEFFLTMGVYLVFAALMIVNLFVVGVATMWQITLMYWDSRCGSLMRSCC